MRRLGIVALLLASVSAEDPLREIRALIPQLRSKVEEERAQAAHELGRYGPAAKIAVPALVKALGDESAWVADLAQKALNRIGPETVPALVKALKDDDVHVRVRAAKLLHEAFALELGHHVRALAAALKDEDRETREHVAAALGKQGTAATDVLLHALDAREEHAREAAVLAFAAWGSGAVPTLLDVLTSRRSDAQRAGAALALGAIGAAEAAVPLFTALDDESPEVAAAAARALGRMGALAGSGVDRLIAGLDDESEVFREGCVDGLVAYGGPALPELVLSLRKEKRRDAAVRALVRIGEPSVAALRDAIEGDPAPVRLAALGILRELPPMFVSDGAIVSATCCLKHEDPVVRATAARTLVHFGLRGKVDELKDLVADQDPEVRRAAVFALGELGGDPGRLDDEDPVVRVEAQLARWKYGGPSCAGELAKTAFDEAAPPRVRAAAVDALGAMGLAAGEVDLPPLLQSESAEVRRATARALGRTTLPTVREIREARENARPDEHIELALDWIAGQQGKDGDWERKGYTAGVTGLALLSFLAAGHGPGHDRHGAAVRKGLDYLVKCQAPNGIIGPTSSHEYILCHGIAALALTEAWMLTGDYRCRRAVQSAVEYIAWARNPGLAWRYGPRDGENDTHITTWLLTTLRIADAAGLDVDREAYAGGAAWIERMTGGEGRTGYNYPGSTPARPEGKQERYPPERVETMTAAGLWCRHLLGGELLEADAYERGIDLLLAKPPRQSAGFEDQIYWYFGAHALFQDGDRNYRKWEKPLVATLEGLQDEKTGAWRERCVWSDDGGPVYTTSMAVLTLLAPTRYPRDFLTKPKLTSADRSAISALKKARSDEDAEVRAAAEASLARLGE